MLSRLEKYKGHEDMIDGISILPHNIKNNFLVFSLGKEKNLLIF